MTAITLAQFEVRNNKLWPHVIGYIEKNNRGSTYFINEIRHFCARYNLNLKFHVLPHDGRNRSWGDQLKRPEDYFREQGEQAITVKRPMSHKVAIEGIRQLLYRTKFNKENTSRLIDCLSGYEKEYDEDRDVFKDEPVHNWCSHGVKSYQTMSLALEQGVVTETTYEVIYYTQF